MISKDHILDEIKRTAAENGGKPLGKGRFLSETGIKESDWSGRYWARWGDALEEAGLAPNQMNAAYSEEHLLEQFASFVKDIGRYPVATEVKMRSREDPSFPSANVFARFGTKADLAARVMEYAETRGLRDVVALCAPIASTVRPAKDRDESIEVIGFVYLIRSGKYFKIGRTNSVGRRERELAIQLPEKARVVHEIKTDDPAGIEGYWHRRFADRRKNGEWFELSSVDVKAFCRRKFM